ncbi:MAG: 16S rRNA (adenine(1518)-N(6)/adenine(1519)-N(6))-dimethyltransferase RsmA [Chromatiales bacterium]|nr:16S rRNA (adenine(1518)-N(6)/adenine(1519)-N(6))-dimethyltransferase RsmA [Chromatiales bacterium]
MSFGPPRRQFGQHFLNDRNIIRKIIRTIAPEPGDHFAEIGPGRGALTRALLERGVPVDAVEIDRELARELPQLFHGQPLRVHCADALKFDFSALAGPGRLRLAGNLPYNISTPLLFHLMSFSGLFTDLHVMLQREVVERIVAQPGSRTYGRLSLTVQARCTTENLFGIGPGCFTPPPKVDSAFLRLVPRGPETLGIRSLDDFDRLVTRAFGQRRKRLGNSLKGLLDDAQIRAAGIDPGLRPEQLDTTAFARLADQLANTA